MWRPVKEISMAADTVTIQVKKGVKVHVTEVDQLEGDRVFVAEAPKGLKLAIRQVDAGSSVSSPSKVTLCG
jgi:hypothetical protein